MKSTITIILAATSFVACSGNGFEQDDATSLVPVTHAAFAPKIGKGDRKGDVAPLPSFAHARRPTASAVWAATSSGDLCLLDATTGSLLDREPCTAIDLIASPDAPARGLASAWVEEGGGVLLDYDITGEGMSLRSQEPLSFEDTRLLYGPTPIIGLGTSEGTTLFVQGEGRGIFRTSSFLAKEGAQGLDLWLLESARSAPRLVHLRWKEGFHEVHRAETAMPGLSCPPRLVRDAPEPLIAGVVDNEVFVNAPDGATWGRRPQTVREDACIEDALWLDGTEQVAVVTGPEIRVHLVAKQGTHAGETLIMSGSIWHDPRPHRRLAFDVSQSRLWIALSDRLEVRRYSPDGHLEPEALPASGCSAESVSLVW